MDDARPRLVYVIDDDEDIRATTADLLDGAGFAVCLASNGQEAVAALLGGLQPDLILLDLNMPVMSGWEFWGWLQGSATLARVPVIVWSASRLAGQKHEFGTTPVVLKGCHPEALIAAIRDTITTSEATHR